MPLRLRLLAVLALLPLAAAAGDEPLRAIDYPTAVAAARDEERVLVLVFVDAKNPEARKLEATWRDGKVREWIGSKAVAIAVDAGAERALAEKFRVDRIPTIVFVDPQGLELDRARGYRDARAFLEDAESIAAGKDAIARTKEKLAREVGNPWLRLDHAHALLDQGKLSEGLARLLECWDRGAVADPSFEPVRTGALLDALVRLEDIFPATTDAILERIQALGQQMVAGGATEAQIGEFVLLATRFERPDLILQVHDLLAEKGEAGAALRRRLAPHLLDTLMEEGRFDEALVSLGDAEKDLETRIAKYAAERAAAALPAGAPDPARDSVAKFAYDAFEAALATKKLELAGKLADRVLAFDGRVETHAELVRRARRARATALAVALMRRGLDGPLSEDDKRLLRQSVVAFPRLK